MITVKKTVFEINKKNLCQTVDRWALRTVLSGVQMPLLKTGPGRLACSKEDIMYVEAHWCRRAGSWLLPTALLGQSCFHACHFQLISSNSYSCFLLALFGHCRSKKELGRWRVVSGRTHMGTLGGSYVDRIIVNGDYNPVQNDYDIALMRLSSPISVGG